MSARVAAAAILCALTFVPPAFAQPAERQVFVTVLGSDGAPLEGLTAEHFAVREGGRDRTVLRVEPLQTPMHVAVLVDSSVGNGRPDEAFKSAVAAFVSRLASFHHVALYTFGDRATRVTGFTQDADALRGALTTMYTASVGGSYLIDAIDLATQDLKPLESPRPVIVAVTSELADASKKTAGAVIKLLVANTTAFHAVALANATGSGSASAISNNIPANSQRMQGMIALGEGDRERTRALREGTTVTGGSLQRVTSTNAVAPALTRLAAELGGSYRLTFGRPGTDAMKDLQVGVMVDNVTLRATPAPKR
ncbi:MAG TPA: VWA domain-containing protein [Vicinamibacterales bacterium]